MNGCPGPLAAACLPKHVLSVVEGLALGLLEAPLRTAPSQPESGRGMVRGQTLVYKGTGGILRPVLSEVEVLP